MSTTIRFRVYGIPKTQGSMVAFAHRAQGQLTGRAFVTHGSSKDMRLWRAQIAEAGRRALKAPPVDGPLGVTITFYIPKPAAYALNTAKQRAQWTYPWRRPDWDKLGRAVMDSLKGVCYRDDGQVVRATVLKVYDDRPGVEVELESL